MTFYGSAPVPIPDALQQVADSQALWAVRVLDAAEEVGFQFDWLVNAGPIRVLTVTRPDMTKHPAFEGPSREAARIAAATALVTAEPSLDPDLSSQLRQMLGRTKREGQSR